MVNVGLLAADIGLPVWGTPANFNDFASWLRYCSDVAQRRPTKLCTIFGRLLDWYIIYTFLGAFAALWNFGTCKIHFASKSAFLYIGSVTAWHSSSWPQLNFAAWYKEWNYGTFAQGATCIPLGGYHVGHRPTC